VRISLRAPEKRFVKRASDKEIKHFKKVKRYVQIGFISVICFMIFIGVVNVINIIDPEFWEGPITSKIATNIIIGELDNHRFIFNPH
jgi:hypothetical protein